jgi:hypothetical protein
MITFVKRLWLTWLFRRSYRRAVDTGDESLFVDMRPWKGIKPFSSLLKTKSHRVTSNYVPKTKPMSGSAPSPRKK